MVNQQWERVVEVAPEKVDEIWCLARRGLTPLRGIETNEDIVKIENSVVI